MYLFTSTTRKQKDISLRKLDLNTVIKNDTLRRILKNKLYHLYTILNLIMIYVLQPTESEHFFYKWLLRKHLEDDKLLLNIVYR